ncbi:MAG TPA: carboxypeptidase-like regulatory domain-containing protein [Bryobacteraceae bacterium]|jgi:hypothetical protein
MKIRPIPLCLAFLVVAGGAAFAQDATIVGTVLDPSGAAVPNVNIKVTNTETGASITTTSDPSGHYSFAQLRIGHYNVRAESSGFKAFEKKDVTLDVGERLRVDITLTIGNASESISVEATAVAVQTETGEVSDVITGQQVTQLATNGRSMYSLATLTAGASSNMADLNTPTPVGGDASVSFNGLRENHNLWLLDGGETADRGGAGGMDVMPSVDSIAEFRALTSNYSAEYGLSSGATMTMIIKSGQKDFHAGAWEFVRNDALDAGPYFTNAAGAKAPELRFNTFGFNVGGPVTLGKIYNKNKDKTFFFYNMEWRKLVQGGLVNTTVPPASEYTGQFNTPIFVPSAQQVGAGFQAALTGAGLTPGAQFPGNKIPASLINPNAAALLAAGIFPSPNSGTQFVGGSNQPTNLREEILRIDHRFNDKFNVFGHFLRESINQTYGTSIWSGDNVPTVGSDFGNPAYHYVLHATYSITPSLLNEIAYNQNGNTINITPVGTFAQPSGLSIPRLFTGSNNENRIPGVSLGQLGTTYDVSSWPWHNQANDYQVRDDVSWMKGSHQMRFGASWALYKKVQDLFGDTQGSFNFNGSYTKNDFADFLLGYAQSYTELAVQDKGDWNNVSPAVYFQDNWHVSKKLTLNLGLRWDGIPHTYEASNRGSNFYPNLYNTSNRAVLLPDGTISPNSPGLGTSPNPILKGVPFYLNGIGIAGQNGIPDGLVQNHWATFGPRIGFAYDLTGDHRSVIRGGFGTMYERIQGNDMYNSGPNLPFSSSVTFNNVSLSNPATSLLTGGTLAAPITVGSITGLSNTDYKAPTSYQYSISFERELAPNTVLSVAYVGNQNRHQSDTRDINLPDPSVLPALIGGTVAYNSVVPYTGFHSIVLAENAENSHYNGLQVNMHARMRAGLTAQVAYTFSRAIDPSFGSGDLAGVSNPYNRAYDIGPSGYDRTSIALVNFIYDIPFFRHSSSMLAKSVLGGWELSGIVVMESGEPLNITLGGPQGSNGLANATNRPDLSGGVSYPGSVTQFFSGNFSLPAIGQWGNLGKGVVRGPGRNNWNTSLFKSFVLNEARGSRFELRVESFNTWNHTEFNAVSSSYSSSNFGQVTSTWDPRVFQLGAKFLF